MTGTNWNPDVPTSWVVKTNVTQMTGEIGSSACIENDQEILRTVKKYLNGHLLLSYNKDYHQIDETGYCTIDKRWKQLIVETFI